MIQSDIVLEGTTMDEKSTSVTSKIRGRGFFMRVVRPHVTAGLTLVSAVVLGLSLVAIPPDVSGTRTEARSVQLAAFRPPSATPLGAALRKYVCTQANTGVSVTPVIVGAPDITTGGVPALLEFVRTVQSTGSPAHATPSAAQTGIDPVLRGEQRGTSVALAIPEVSQLASVAFNPLWPVAVLFFVVVIPVFAVLLFFFPPVFPAIASAVSAIPEPLDPPVVQDTDVLNAVANEANSGEALDESGRIGLDEAVDESGQVGLDEAVDESGQVGLDEAVDESGQVALDEAVDESGQVALDEAVDESGQVESNQAGDESGKVESKEAADESGQVESNDPADDRDRVALSQKGSDTSQAAASKQQTAGAGQATSQPAGPTNSTPAGDPSAASS